MAVPFIKQNADVGEVRPLEVTNRLSPSISKNEVATYHFQHTTTCEAHHDVFYFPKSSGQGTIDVQPWKYHGTLVDEVC